MSNNVSLDLSKRQISSLTNAISEIDENTLSTVCFLNLDFNFELSRITQFECELFPSLKKLSMRGCNFKNMYSLVKALKCFPGLQELSLQSSSEANSRKKTLQNRDQNNPTNSSSLAVFSRLIRLLNSRDIDIGFSEIVNEVDVLTSGVSPTSNEASNNSNNSNETPETNDVDGEDPFVNSHIRNIHRLFSRGVMLNLHLCNPLCGHNLYRSYLIHSLKNLQILDQIPITEDERAQAKELFTEHFERSPYDYKENMSKLLFQRQLHGKSFSRYLSSPPPPPRIPLNTMTTSIKNSEVDVKSINGLELHSHSHLNRSVRSYGISESCRPFVHISDRTYKMKSVCSHTYRPRQFEYHPTIPRYLLVGSMVGTVHLYNQYTNTHLMETPLIDDSSNSVHNILGLCWLNGQWDKFLAGSDQGQISLFSFTADGQYQPRRLYSYPKFDKLTCLHINNTDDRFLTSGYGNDVQLYNLCDGSVERVLPSLHSKHINVLKFAHQTPWLFVTSSFDRTVKLWDIRMDCRVPITVRESENGNVTCCFSDDDRTLLASAIDNEVRLYDIRMDLIRKFDIPQRKSNTNYTRSYFLNSSDYILVGSYEEDCVHILNTYTGKILTDVQIDYPTNSQRTDINIQSLRGDPHHPFNFSVLVAYRDIDMCEIIHVDMLKSAED